MSFYLAEAVIDVCVAQPEEGAQKNPAIEKEILSLFDLMGTSLLRYALHFGLSVQDGEDVVQETFLALFHHLREQRSAENLRGWLYRVTHNLALKSRARRKAGPLPCEADDLKGFRCGPTPEEEVLFGERHARLQSTLRALPPLDQQCLRLRAEGLRYREISATLGISLGSVAASLTRSLERLQRMEGR